MSLQKLGKADCPPIIVNGVKATDAIKKVKIDVNLSELSEKVSNDFKKESIEKQ